MVALPSSLALLVVLAGCVDEATPVQVPAGEQRLVDLRPVAYWRFGESTGTSARDVVTGLEAAYHGVTLGREGAIIGDADTAVGLDGRSYIDLADHRIYSLARAHDQFHRTWVFGWGRSAGGDAWLQLTGSPLDYAVHDGKATMNLGRTDGVFEQGIAHMQLVDGELQARFAFSEIPARGYLAASLIARRIDRGTFVRAEVRVHADQHVELAIVRTVAHVDEDLASTVVPGTYTADAWWYVRFHFTDALRAKAWPKDTTYTRQPGDCFDPGTGLYACEVSHQPDAWQLDAKDPAPGRGTVAIRYHTTRSSTDALAMVASFWAQTAGITFHLWWRPTAPDLVVNGERDSAGDPFVEVAGKGSGRGDGDDEYAFKLYGNNAAADCGVFKAYIHNLEGGFGAGARYPRQGDCHTAPDPIEPNVWHQLVVVYTAGDYLDRAAGVRLFVDGALYLDVGEGLGTTYSGLDPLEPGYPRNAAWQIVPRGGDAPLRIGTRSGRSFFTGVIDEFAIFSRALTANDVATLRDQNL